MGNDHGKLKGLDVDRKAVEVTDFWSLYNAEIETDDRTTFLSIFEEEPFVNGQLWVQQSPLKRAIKNLMIFRHPCILKYVTSWDQGSQKRLATERVQPLSLLIQNQSDIQICLGLRNILCSLIFLVEQAKARHINICISSIYVNSEGEWRLGGFEYVWRAKELTKGLLDLAQPYRHKNSVEPNESKGGDESLEQYAFAVLSEDILKSSKNADTPYVTEFRDYCATHLKHQNVAMRPKLSAVLLHPYFNHEFVLIHSFLTELPLKSPQEKQDFFTGLVDRLRYFDEVVVASQVGNLLLCRMVLLDTTAQLCVTPYVLKTKTEISAALFSSHTFTKYIIPRIKQIFCVRDAQIRLILLEYFNEYVKLLTKEELQDQILPNLLLGIKDTNDILVAKTLRCLADLVPILGSEIVIGGNRARLFADGRPQRLPDSTSHWVEPRSITPVMTSGDYILSASPLPDNVDMSESYVSVSTVENMQMPERLSPDGGEDIQAATDGEPEEDAWSDWENDELRAVDHNLPPEPCEGNEDPLNQAEAHSSREVSTVSPARQPTQTPKLESKPPTNKVIDDINELDIKVQKIALSGVEEIDFFKDMEPVIQSSTSTVLLPQLEGELGDKRPKGEPIKGTEEVQVDKSRFEFKAEGDIPETGWDDDSNDWGD